MTADQAPTVPVVPVKLPGSFCDWATAALADASGTDPARAALDGARRIDRRFGYYVILDATAAVLDTLTALATDCVAQEQGRARTATYQAARTVLGRLRHAHATLAGETVRTYGIFDADGRRVASTKLYGREAVARRACDRYGQRCGFFVAVVCDEHSAYPHESCPEQHVADR